MAFLNLFAVTVTFVAAFIASTTFFIHPWCIDITVPVVLNKIHGLPASAVAVAILAPVFLMARRHPQVNRLADHGYRPLLNDDGLREDHQRTRHKAHINAAIKPGLGYFLFIAFIIANNFVWPALDVESNLIQYGASPDLIYSDMNAFGPFLKGKLAFEVYWLNFLVRRYYAPHQNTLLTFCALPQLKTLCGCRGLLLCVSL